MEVDYAIAQEKQTLKYFVAVFAISSLIAVLIVYTWMIYRHRQTYWVSFNPIHFFFIRTIL